MVIKECLPVDISCRIDGVVQARTPEQAPQYASILRHFLREARRLSKLSHPNIVGVHQVFEENDTAYMALDFIHGMDLLSIIEDDPERLSPKAIRTMLMKSLEAISYIHEQGILHRDISPDNFLLDWDDNITLIDFGAARDEATKANRALSALLAVKDGYSPQEFYLSDLVHSAASDLYSLGATFYHLIAGQAPPNSQSRLAAIEAETQDPYRPLTSLKTNYDHNFLAAIDQALQLARTTNAANEVNVCVGTGILDPEQRLQNIFTEPGYIQRIGDRISLRRRQGGRRAAADEDRADASGQPLVPAVQLGQQGGDETFGQLGPVDDRVEVAVAADRAAERHVYVE